MKYIGKVLKYNLMKKRIKRQNPFEVSNVEGSAPIIYLFFAACGTNMGDHAIVKVEKDFIKRILPTANIIEIKVAQTESAIVWLKKNIRKQDLIILSGGGYLGDEYIEVYLPLIRIIKLFSKNKILIFPQTVFFHQERNQNRFFELCKKCNNIKIFVREEQSQQICNKSNLSVELVPDIVFWATPKHNYGENRILLCMRNDVEKAFNSSDIKIMENLLKKYGEVCVTDTVNEEIFQSEEREIFLNKMLERFSKSSLVITDRIHGMIFSYMTNTPCVVFGNYNHKVREEYKWIKSCDSICFLENFNNNIFEKKSEMFISNEK